MRGDLKGWIWWGVCKTMLILSSQAAWLGIYLGMAPLFSPLVPASFFHAMVASVIFHAQESSGNHATAGVPTYRRWVGSILMMWDWAASMMCFLVVLDLAGPVAVAKEPLVWIALFFNGLGDLHYAGIITAKSWDIYVYPVVHSVWHVLAFKAAGRLLVQGFIMTWT